MSIGNESERRLRKAMGKKSILAFADIYLSHHIKTKSPSFHKTICDCLMEMSNHRNKRLAIAAPRGYAKSTLVNLFYVLWSICYGKERFILIFSATADQAQSQLATVSKELQTNALLRDDFADVFSTKSQIKAKFTQDEIITPNDIKVKAYGAGQGSRGVKHNEHRPTLIILDDIDGEKNTYSSKSRENIFNWFSGVVLYMGAINVVNTISIGTLVHIQSLLTRLTNKEEFLNWDKLIYKAIDEFSKRDDLWQRWENIARNRGESYEGYAGLEAADRFFQDNKADMLKDTKVLWEEQEDYYTLMKIKTFGTSYSFDSEKQNDPTKTRDSCYDPENFHYWDDQFPTLETLLESFGGDYSYIGACDPSVGVKSGRSDHSAIIILVQHKGRLYVIDADITERSQEDLVQAIVDYCKIRHPMDNFVIEANLFPELLLNTVRNHAYKENVLAPFKEIRNTKNKEQRIFGMKTYLTSETVFFSRKHTTLIEQLKYFPRGEHDDGPDALEMAIRAAENRVSFLPLNDEDIRDKWGRKITDRDFGQPPPEELA
ncbi:MAG: phage terminase large subunit [Candidatus Omnitrophica bacterium]|nr:phage terminase large subunit [Candidatus Omnitrophota bacterium]